MITTVLKVGSTDFTWIDVVNPSREELDKVAGTYGLHQTSVLDCLDPEHLPKHERIGEITFIIIRAADELADPMAETVQDVTRKIAIFYSERFLITIHRKDQSFLGRLRDEQVQRAKAREARCSYILTDLINAALATFDKPLDEAETTVEQFEKALFDPQQASPSLQKVHILKRRVSLMKRLLWQTLIVVHRITPQSDRSSPHFQDVGENCESYHFYADELLEEVNNLLSIHLAMASHRTNEVMRVLTVFSAFFLPLTFIVGIYGMNFEHMPELHHPFGYAAVMLVMLGVSGLIFVWFRRRGWLRRPQTSEPKDA